MIWDMRIGKAHSQECADCDGYLLAMCNVSQLVNNINTLFLTREERLMLTVVNPHAGEAREADVSLRGGAATSAQVTLLTAPDIHAHNDFDQPAAVQSG